MPGRCVPSVPSAASHLRLPRHMGRSSGDRHYLSSTGGSGGGRSGGSGSSNSKTNRRLRRPLLASREHGPASDDYAGFIPLEEDGGWTYYSDGEANPPTAATPRGGAPDSPRITAGEDEVGGYESSSSVESWRSPSWSSDRGSAKKKTTKIKLRLRRKTAKGSDDSAEGAILDADANEGSELSSSALSSSSPAVPWSCFNSFLGEEEGRGEENGSFPSSPSSDEKGRGRGGSRGASSESVRRRRQRARSLLNPASSSSLWRCKNPCAQQQEPSQSAASSSLATSSRQRQRHRDHHPAAPQAGGGGGPGCCSSPRIGPDGHALAADVPPVPPFLSTGGSTLSGASATKAKDPRCSPGTGIRGVLRADAFPLPSSASSAVSIGSSGAASDAGSWADALAGAAVFGTGAAARAAGAAANGGCVPYSQRSAVTDGAEPQPEQQNGASGAAAAGGSSSMLMERRALRPNGSHLATSHWSDGNRRGYMEDRYAIEPMGTVTTEATAATAAQAQLKPPSSPLPSSISAGKKHLPALEHSPSPRGVEELTAPPSSSVSDDDDGQGEQALSLFSFDPVFPPNGEGFEMGLAGPCGSSVSDQRVVVPATLYGVYDGHGGPNASQYCSDWMATYVRRQHSWPLDPAGALTGAFDEADGDFVASGHLDGTTACVALVLGSERVVVANAGDSRCVVVRRDGSVARLSRDHKPGTPDETRRITDLGGRVMYVGGRWRVMGSLAVSRGVGDAALKPYISSEPELCEYDLDDDDLFLVIATDGVWDVMENEYVGSIVMRKATTSADGSAGRKTDPARLRATARRLCDEARRQGSSDNLCAIVVDLKSSVHPLSRPSRW